MTVAPAIIHSETEIASRVDALAKEIAPLKPQIAVAILIGGFVFASDLVRALARAGVHLEVEFLWLRSYGNERAGGAVSLLAGPSENVRIAGAGCCGYSPRIQLSMPTWKRGVTSYVAPSVGLSTTSR